MLATAYIGGSVKISGIKVQLQDRVYDEVTKCFLWVFVTDLLANNTAEYFKNK